MRKKYKKKLKAKTSQNQKKQTGYTVKELLKLGEENNYFELAKPLFNKEEKNNNKDEKNL